MSNLDTFAKVRVLHDRAATAGEKAAAASRMEALARSAGMTVAEALSKLDTPKSQTPAQAAAASLNDFFNTPQMRAERGEREAKRKVKADGLIDAYGSEDAVFVDTPLEAALRAACEPLLGPGQTWNTIYRLDGWGLLDSRAKMPASVRKAVSEAWPLPSTVAEAWSEFAATDKLTSDRYILDCHCDPHAFVEARLHIVEKLCDTIPARSLNDLRARLSWLEHWANCEVEQDVESYRTTLVTLRADIERMGVRIWGQTAEFVQSGQPSDDGEALPHSTRPVQTGHPRRTNAEKRRDVLALLGGFGTGNQTPLTDREIARRTGVSPTTVGSIRRGA